MSDRVRLHSEASGSGGVPVLLVHGYGMSSAGWEKLLPLFPAGYRLLAVDLRGFGGSDKPESGCGCADLADDLAAFLDAEGLAQAVVVGHSFGGLVAQHFAARHPHRVLALVLCNTAATLPPQGLTPAVEQRLEGHGSDEENRGVLAAAIPATSTRPP